MPVRLSTTLSKIFSVPNSTNADLLDRLYAFMNSTGASESHCNNTLKTAIAFARYLGSDQSFYDIRTKDKIVGFLDTKMKDNFTDPDKRWITTWNDYLGDLKYLFRWLHNYKLKLDIGLEPRGRIPWNLGNETSIETRRKISKTLTGTHRPESVRIRISKGNLGKKKSELHRLHLSQAIKGKKRRPLLEETKRKISEKQKGKKDKPLSEKHKQSISKKLKGIVRSKKTRQKMSQAGFLRTHTLETRRKLSLIRVKQIFPRKDSKIEVRLQEILTKNNIHYTKHEPLRGQPDIFILPNICIFVDGWFWHADPRYFKPNDFIIGTITATKRWEYDRKTTMALILSGYIVLRFWEDDINTNLEGCFKVIKERIN